MKIKIKTKAAIRVGTMSHFFDGRLAGMITFEWINPARPAGRDLLNG